MLSAQGAGDSLFAVPGAKARLIGGAEAYYAFDFNNPASKQAPNWVYAYGRHNEIGLNNVYVGFNYAASRLRSQLALATGNYMQRNYAAEPPLLRNLLEANVGFKVVKNYNLWLDVGVMPSHIGFESAIGNQNWTLTRSIMANNSPYFMTGARLGLTTQNEKWFIALLALNGWQNIMDNNSNKVIASQLTYMSNSKLTFNWSSFYGEGYNVADSVAANRLFQNLYASWQVKPKLGLAAVADFGLQETAYKSKVYRVWWTAAFFARYQIKTDWRAIARIEYFNDPNQLIITSLNNVVNKGFRVGAYSLGLDYSPFENALLRIEAKYYFSENYEFWVGNGKFSKNSFVLTTSMGYNF
jgi:hypothetical protein